MNVTSETVPTRTTVEQSIEAPAHRQVLDYDDVLKFKDGDTTPSVANLTKFMAVGSATITQFDDGQEGQVIYILGNGNTQVEDNSNIKRRSGSTGTLDADKVYVFIRMFSVWYETA